MDNSFFANVSMIDIILVASFIGFVIAGIVRGFTSDVLGLFTWVGAIFSTTLLFPYVEPYGLQYIEQPFFAQLASAFVTFIFSLIILVAIAKIISKGVRKSILSGLDRSLGIVSGFFRATVLVTFVFLFGLSFWDPGNTPDLLNKSRLLPVFSHTGRLVHEHLIPEALFPKHLLPHLYGNKKFDRETTSVENLVESLSSPQPASQKEEDKAKYKLTDQTALEKLVDKVDKGN